MKKELGHEAIYDARQLGTPRMLVLGLQHMFAMFGATVLVPILVQGYGLPLSIQTTLLFAGLGTLLFHVCTKFKVPAFLGSSFAYLGGFSTVATMPAYEGLDPETKLAYALGGIVIAGLLYLVLALLFKLLGAKKVMRYFPPIVTGPMIIMIGLNLSGSAINNASTCWWLALVAMAIIVVANIWGKGMVKIIPILLGVVGSYIVAVIAGQVDFSGVSEASFLGFQQFVIAKFDVSAILVMAPIAIAAMMEHIGDISAISSTTGKNFIEDPGLHRTLVGDGLATAFAGFFGGPANTTYGENTGVLALSKVYDPRVVRLAAIYAIILSFSPKFDALVNSIPAAIFAIRNAIILKKTDTMLTLKQIRDDKEAAVRKLAKKGVEAGPIIEKIISLDDRRKAIQVELDSTLAAQNKAAKEIGALMGQGRREEAEERKHFVTDLKEKSASLQAESNDVQQELQTALVSLPNFPAEIVPEGKTAADNLVVKLVESYTTLPENPLPHWELARKYDIIDFDLGVKLTGAGFPVYKGKGARLQRALINYFLDCNTKAGYLEVEPPVMVNEASGFGTGQLPDKEGQMYHATVDNFYLVPTAEVPVTNIYRDVILDESDFPVKMTAYTPCFRREAGSYGKDVRGLNRLHQFDKVEIVQLSLPNVSYEALDGMVAHVEGIVRSLGLPFRILRLCGGDMSFTSALTYDFEVYSEAQKRWLEVSSVSNFESFQANRLKLRYRDAEKKIHLAHTLNGSSLALPRIVAALLENYQTPEGIRIPEVLIPGF